MSQHAILLPFLSMLILTFVVWVVLFARRIPMLQKSDADLTHITKAELTSMSPSHVIAPSENFLNLFELPVAFYAIVLYLFSTSSVDGFYVAAAWIFVAGRYCHSYIHCAGKAVPIRFGFYLVSSLALWTMIFRAAWQLLVS